MWVVRLIRAFYYGAKIPPSVPSPKHRIAGVETPLGNLLISSFSGNLCELCSRGIVDRSHPQVSHSKMNPVERDHPP